MTVIQKGKKPGEPRKEDYQVFNYETNRMIENFTYPYAPVEEEDDEFGGKAAKEIKGIDEDSMTMIDASVIPSSHTLLKCEASSMEEIREFKEKLNKIHLDYNENFQVDLKMLDEKTNDPEAQTKAMLPSIKSKDTDPS